MEGSTAQKHPCALASAEVPKPAITQTPEITKHQLHLLHHTLGVTPERRESYRNHFVAGVGHHDQSDLEALEMAGFMKRVATPKFLDDGDVVFQVTNAGRDYALYHLPPAPPVPKKSRYSEYLNADTGYSFADFLDINKPQLQTKYGWRRSEKTTYRFVRYTTGHYCYTEVTGEWATTKTAAKASYKEALKKYRAAIDSGRMRDAIAKGNGANS
jgi:hypothetical protein